MHPIITYLCPFVYFCKTSCTILYLDFLKVNFSMMDKTETVSSIMAKLWYIHSMWSLKSEDELYTVITSKTYYTKNLLKKKIGYR